MTESHEIDPRLESNDLSDIHRPLAEPPEVLADPSGGRTGRRRRWPIVVAAVFGILIVGTLAAFVFVRRAVGSPLDAAAALPADTDFVVTVDFLHFVRNDRLERTIEAFARPLRQAGVIEEAPNALDTIDEELDAEFGITATDDIVPWIGRSAAFGIRDVVGLAQDADRPTGLVFALDVRDRGAAAEFIERLPDIFERDGAGVVTEITVAGRTVGRFEPADFDEADTLFVLEKDLIILASDRATLRASFEAIEGESIADDETFQTAIGELEPDRGATVYLASRVFDELRDEIADSGFELESDMFGLDTLSRIQAIAGAAGLSEDGAWLDVVQVFDGPASSVTDGSAAPIRDTLPASTLLYVGATYDRDVFDQLADAIREQDPEAYDQFIEEFEANVGLHPIDDIVDHIGGGFALAVLPARAGILSTNFGVDIGFVGATAVEDSASLGRSIDLIEDQFAGDEIQLDDDGSVTRVFVDEEELFSYALTDTDLVIGTSSSVVGEAITAGANSLTNTQLYQDLDLALPGEGMVFYLDMQGMLDTVVPPDVAEPEDFAGLLPIRGFGASNRIDDNIAISRFVMLIDFAANFDAGV